MNAQDYISSGLLEAYVLGSLSEAEQEQVAGAICRFPQVAQEVVALEEALFQHASQFAAAPPPALEDAIWAKLEAQPRTEMVVEPASRSIPLPPPALPADVPERRRRAFPIGMAAAVALLIASLGANYFILQDGRQREQTVLAANQRLETELASRTADFDRMRERYIGEAEMAASPAMQTIAMRSLKPGEAMAATMYWNASTQKAFVSVHKLPPPPSGMQYQLWAIADGKPVSLGMIDNEVATQGGMQPVAAGVEAGQAFAVSLEKAGGVPSPTAERIMLMGKVPA